jgi:hypothetical protein
MLTRIGVAALVLGAVAFTGGGALDAHPADCEFDFKFHNPARVVVRCEDNLAGHNTCFAYLHGHVNVYTNACTRVHWEADNYFVRKETDCDGNELTHVDRVPTCTCLAFQEVPLCQDGHPLTVKDDPAVPGVSWQPGFQVGNGTVFGLGYIVPNTGTVIVDSHRGGYYIAARIFPNLDELTLCEDNGCYTASIKFWITTIPNECRNVPGMDTFSFGT